MPHRVLLVREVDAQHSSSGCCGRLGGIDHELGEPDTYAHTRCDMEAMGAVYRALYDALEDDVDLQVVDPRNSVWLYPAIWRDARRRGFGHREALRQLARGVSSAAVVADGCVLFSGRVPDPEEAVAAVRAALVDT